MPNIPKHPGQPEEENERFAHNPSAEKAGGTLDPSQKKNTSAENDSDSDASDLSAAENNPAKVGAQSDASGQEQAPWSTKVGGNDKKSKGKKKMSKRKKRILTAVFMLIATSVFGVAAFFIFLPFKIVNVMENMKEAASHLSERPMEQRFTFLLTRFLAGKIVAGEDANQFDRYVCPSGGIACSVFKTWRLNKFEEKLGLKIESNRSGNGRATSWKITTRDGTVIEGGGGNFDEIVEQMTREIDGTRIMRAWLREEIKGETKWYNMMQRYAQRKMLMRKYGVTGWRGPEKLENKYDTYADYKRAIKLKLKKIFSLASLGRVLKKSAAIITCLVAKNSNACANLQRSESPPPEAPEESTGSDADREGQEAARDGQANIGSEGGSIDTDAIIDEVSASAGDDSRAFSKTLSNTLTKKLLATGVAGIGIIDTLASIVEKIDQGDVNAAVEYKNEIAYIGYATEWATITDKMKDGDLDPETAQAAAEIITNYETSPLAQHENGLSEQLGKPGHEVERDCDGDGTMEKLAPDEYICPNKKITADVTEFITSWPAWDAVVVPIATAWNNSVGAVFNFFNDIAGGILDAVGFTKLMEWVISITGLGDLAESVMESVFNAFIGSPITGIEEDDDAYDAMSIGVTGMYNSMMKTGVDQEGEGMGAGGKVLTPEEIAEVNNAAARDSEEDFQSQSLMARLFDPHLTGSAVNTLVARTPSNLSSILYTPIASLSSLASPSAGAFPFRNENPAGYVIYGYAEGSSAFTAPPEAYTEATCKQMAAARDASYYRGEGETSPSYHLEDPCALEKVICASATAIYEENECTQEFNLYTGGGGETPTDSLGGTPGQTKPLGQGFTLENNTDYSQTPCAEGSKETKIYTHPKNGYKVRLCKVRSMEIASIISDKVVAMINSAAQAGVDLNGGAFRDYEAQINTRRNNCNGDPLDPNIKCSPPTAVPGNSQHERGLAIDFGVGGTIKRGSAQFNWLSGNAAKYGFYNLPSESWHWSTSGN